MRIFFSHHRAVNRRGFFHNEQTPRNRILISSKISYNTVVFKPTLAENRFSLIDFWYRLKKTVIGTCSFISVRRM